MEIPSTGAQRDFLFFLDFTEEDVRGEISEVHQIHYVNMSQCPDNP